MEENGSDRRDGCDEERALYEACGGLALLAASVVLAFGAVGFVDAPVARLGEALVVAAPLALGYGLWRAAR